MPRDVQGNLTANGVKKFMASNEGAIKGLLGKEHFNSLSRISQDLRSESKVFDSAFKSSKGNSVTAQRQTVAGVIQDSILGSIIPGVGGIARVAESIKNTANIKNSKQVQDLLFRAAMEPEFALILSMTPTNKRVWTAMDFVKQFTNDIKGTFTNATTGVAKAVAIKGSNLASQESEKERRLLEKYPQSTKEQLLKPNIGDKKAKGDRIEFQNVVPSLNNATNPTLKQPISYTRENIKQILKDEPPIVKAIAKIESNYNHKAKSPKGALGLFQLMPANIKKFGVKDPFDPAENLNGMKQLLSEELERYRDSPLLAIAAYNVGSPRVNKAIEKAGSKNWTAVRKYLPNETQNYVYKFLQEVKRV
jgi:Transglycosylase SLT domain